MTEAANHPGKDDKAGAKVPAAGRPTLYAEPMVREILERMIEGESLRSICRDDHMPGKSTVMDWLDAHEDFRTKYARARDLQADHLFDEMREIADDGSNDWMDKHNADGEVTGRDLDHEHVQRSKLRVATRQWQAEKLAPKKYGAKIGLEHTGPNGEPLTQFDPITAATRISAILQAAAQRKEDGA